MKRFLIALTVLLVFSLVLGYAILSNGPNERSNVSSSTTTVIPEPPPVSKILSRLNSYTSFCWAVDGTSLSLFGVRAENVKGCVNYTNDSAVYWIRTIHGRSFPYVVNSTANDLDWSMVTSSVWPEINIVNFLRWMLESGNVTEVKRAGDNYEFHIFLRYVEESNAGTIENPYLIRILQTWNVTLLVNGDGEPLNGHFTGSSRGPSNVYGANWLHEGNFTFLGRWTNVLDVQG